MAYHFKYKICCVFKPYSYAKNSFEKYIENVKNKMGIKISEVLNVTF